MDRTLVPGTLGISMQYILKQSIASDKHKEVVAFSPQYCGDPRPNIDLLGRSPHNIRLLLKSVTSLVEKQYSYPITFRAAMSPKKPAFWVFKKFSRQKHSMVNIGGSYTHYTQFV